MPLTSAQRARNIYAAKVRARATAPEIEQARGDLEYAKARQAITAWSSLLNADQLAALADQLRGGASDAA